MNCLVTGGSGFIGSNLVDRLVELGHKVTVIDNFSAECNDEFYINKVGGCFYLKEDICNYDRIEHYFKDIDWVFHLAAESRIGPTMRDPQKACEVNFVGTCNVLQAARKHGVKKVVYSSTSACYGLANVPPLVETMPNDNLNPYSVSKIAAEDLCVMCSNLFEVPTVCLRYFNVFGERMPDRGQYAPVVAIFMKQLREGNNLTIVGDGLQKRDFIYVQDVVSANIMAAEAGTNCNGEIFNVGSGENISILNIAKSFNADYEHVPPRDGEAQTTLANIDKIKDFLGWEPTTNVLDWIKNWRDNR